MISVNNCKVQGGSTPVLHAAFDQQRAISVNVLPEKAIEAEVLDLDDVHRLDGQALSGAATRMSFTG